MSLIAKLLVSLVIAIIASTLVNLLFEGEIFDARLLIAFFVSTAATALIVGVQHGKMVQCFQGFRVYRER